MSEERRHDEDDESLHVVHKKLDLIIIGIGDLMADVSKLENAINELGADEVAAVTELKQLAEEIAKLSTEQAPSQEQIDVITAKAEGIATALKAGTVAAEPVEAPPVETPQPPVEQPAPPVETPVPPVEGPTVTNPPETTTP